MYLQASGSLAGKQSAVRAYCTYAPPAQIDDKAKQWPHNPLDALVGGEAAIQIFILLQIK